MGMLGPDLAAATISEGTVTRVTDEGLFATLNETDDDYEYGPLGFGFLEPAVGSAVLIAHGGNLSRVWVVSVDA